MITLQQILTFTFIFLGLVLFWLVNYNVLKYVVNILEGLHKKYGPHWGYPAPVTTEADVTDYVDIYACWLTKGCDGRMSHVLTESMCTKCGMVSDMQGVYHIDDYDDER